MQEIWIEIKGFEGNYKLSSYGNVYSFALGCNKKIQLGKRGYYVIDLCKKGTRKNVKIHRLLAIHFISNPENKPHINHKNGIKTDNRLSNLEWVTKIENDAHARRTGLNKDFGSNHHNAKLNETDVLAIRQSKDSDVILADIYGVSRKNINKIRHNKTWKHV